MKTKDLIRRLQAADPSGELDVTIGKADIWYIEVLPGYYDGCYQVLKRDDALEDEGYNLVGAEIRAKGQHICLNSYSVKEMLWSYPDLPVTYDGDSARKKYEASVAEWRTAKAIAKAKDAKKT